jgi:hypothetical protein
MQVFRLEIGVDLEGEGEWLLGLKMRLGDGVNEERFIFVLSQDFPGTNNIFIQG